MVLRIRVREEGGDGEGVRVRDGGLDQSKSRT
jgi:hypothetical protein